MLLSNRKTDVAVIYLVNLEKTKCKVLYNCCEQAEIRTSELMLFFFYELK